jgi:predicted ATPase/DNA-binding winged helix-turn-helix (wHTH) protein
MSPATRDFQAEPTMHFEGFELRRGERQLLRDGVVVPLRGKAFDLLLALAERPGHLVTKEELLDVVWHGRVVEENNIAAQIAALRKSLRADLIVTVPGHGYRFIGMLQPSASEPQAIAATVARAVRAAPILFGREQDVARLELALSRPGCVTLLGPAGVGKTSLARTILARASGPAHWVDLASLTAGEQIFPALCRALGLPHAHGEAMEAVAAALRGSGLLVLDNAEHIVGPTADAVALLLTNAPGLRLLVTSQAPLAIEGERTQRLSPLQLPSVAANEPDAVAAGALAMFIDRVRAAHSGFQFTPGRLAVARRLCVELDGLPLAIEMAAARVPLLGLDMVHDSLAERFVALRNSKRDAPARHKTLQTALDWSYELLSAPEQALLRALGVCAGGFTADLAVALVDADRWDTIGHLGSLVDRSLVVSSHDDPPRHRLLETVRAYSLARLREAGEETAVRARHARALAELFHLAHDAVSSPVSEATLRVALLEVENAREALFWAQRNQPEIAVRLSACVARATSTTGWRTETFGWLAGCEALARDPLLDARWRALWARQFAAQSVFYDDHRALARAREAVAICRAAGEHLHMAYSLIYMARTFKGPDAELRSVIQEAGALVDEHSDFGPDLRVLFLNCKGHADELDGNVELAMQSWRAGVEIARVANLRLAENLSSFNLGRALQCLGRHDEALAVLARATTAGEDVFDVMMMKCKVLRLRVMLEGGHWEDAAAGCDALLRTAQRLGSIDMLDVLAPGLARAGRPRAAALLIGLIKRVRKARGVDSSAGASTDIRLATERALQVLDRATFDLLVEAGSGLDAPEATELLHADDGEQWASPIPL